METEAALLSVHLEYAGLPETQITASNHSHVFRLSIQSKKPARSHRVNLGGLVSLCSVELCLWRNSNGESELHPFSTGKEKQLYSTCPPRALAYKSFLPLDATLHLI